MKELKTQPTKFLILSLKTFLNLLERIDNSLYPKFIILKNNFLNIQKNARKQKRDVQLPLIYKEMFTDACANFDGTEQFINQRIEEICSHKNHLLKGNLVFFYESVFLVLQNVITFSLLLTWLKYLANKLINCVCQVASTNLRVSSI